MNTTTIKPIRTEADYEAALSRVDQLMGSKPGTEDFDDLCVLTELVESFEAKQYPIEAPNPIDAIKFRLEQLGQSNRDLLPIMGTHGRISEVMNGKRPLSLQMIRGLHAHFGIPADVLIQEPASELPDEIDYRSFPIKELMKRGWLGKFRDAKTEAEDGLRWLLDCGAADQFAFALLKQSSCSYANTRTDKHALYAWCLHVRCEALAGKRNSFSVGSVDFKLLDTLAHFSCLDDGPRHAVDLLRENGISVVFAQHLAGTYLDGAAMLLPDGSPVIGLTLRHNRLDNYWFALLHELAHVGRHLCGGEQRFFQDDFEVKGEKDQLEQQADEWAADALVPNEELDAIEDLTYASVIELARRLHVSPAVVAGRIRHELDDYRRFAKLLGHGEPKRVLQISW